jgi:ribosomal protein S27E
MLLGFFIAIFVMGFAKAISEHMKLRRQLELQNQNQSVEERAGHFVQVDCKECGKVNRIPADRLRSRPICGGCKSKLLPKRKITLYTIKNLEFDRALSLELDSVISDYDKFWPTLDAHFKRKGVNKTTPLDAKDLPN